MEYGRYKRHIGQVGQVAFIGVVADQRIAIRQSVLSIEFQDPLD